MSLFILASSVILSLLFLASGIGKALDIPGTAHGFTSLRLPFPDAHRRLAVGVAALEIALTVGLWLPWGPVAAAAAWIALALLILFTAIIARALTFKAAAYCACFGTLGSPALSRLSLVRNGGLIALALIAAVGASAGTSLGAALRTAPASAAGIAFAVVATVLVTLLVTDGARGGTQASTATPSPPEVSEAASHAPAASASPEPHPPHEHVNAAEYVRAPIPYASLAAEDHTIHSLRSLAQDRAVLLLFVSTTCAACLDILERMEAWQARLAPFVEVVAVFAEPQELIPEYHRGLAGGRAMEDIDLNASNLLGLTQRPAATLLGVDGFLAGGPVEGPLEVAGFVGDIIGEIEALAPAAQE